MGNNNSANETNPEHRMDTIEQTLMKVVEQVHLLTSTFSLLKEVQPPQGDTSGARKETNPTAEDEVNYIPTRDNGLSHGDERPSITVDEPNHAANPTDFRKELET